VEAMTYVPSPPSPDFIGKWICISTGSLILNDVIALTVRKT
jgi:hypothetical protein